MFLGRIAISLSIATILSLDLILLLGAGVQDPRSIRPLCDGLVMVMDLCLVSSSGLLGFLFGRRGRRTLAVLFFLNIGLFALAFVLRLLDVPLHPLLLFGADLYWLNLYLVCLTRYWRLISG
jgi:hypothetical protein